MKTLKISTGSIIFMLLLFSCNRNEFAPEIIYQEFTIEENTPGGTIIGSVEASDQDEGETLIFEIVDGNDEGICEIDPSNGSLSVNDPLKLDYETITQIILTVSVSDGHKKEPLESAARIKINILDINEYAPEIEPQSFSVNENPFKGQIIGMVEASDLESHQKLSYHIIDQNENAYFQIDSLTGMFSVLDTSLYDYELSQSLSALILVCDDHENSLTDTAEITIQIMNVPEVKHFTIQLQPDGEKGKDALFGKIVPDTNYGESENIHLYAWTQSGVLNITRTAIDFNLSGIPAEARIDSAYLSLYFNTTSAYGDKHEGETSFMIQRIRSGWEESTVTWRNQPSTTTDNQVVLDGASLPTQNFTDINITQLIRDYCHDMDNSYGFLLKLQHEEPYRMLLLASSEHSMEQLRPKLEVYYTLIE